MKPITLRAAKPRTFTNAQLSERVNELTRIAEIQHNALEAITARHSGRFDHPALVAFGPLSTDRAADMAEIAGMVLEHRKRKTPIPSDPWGDNAIQFPRLIEEAQTAGAFTPEVIATIAESMSLEPAQVGELMQRARVQWASIVVGLI